ncbi:MAG: DegT/DnrJ/EryC1/StrS family aminotransferase [Verrucomicrobiota bacterium]
MLSLPTQPDGDLHVGRPTPGDRALFNELVDGIFDRRRFTNNGDLVRELELRLCKYLGVRHCIPVCNGTTGLQLACRALKLEGEVIVPAFTFPATVHALQWQGVRPVFADVDPKTHNLDPAAVEKLITPRTTGILGVHLWGRPCQPDIFQTLARTHGLKLLFDAAHAFGAAFDGRRIGNFGRCEVFSFHATKFFHTFEGGAVATNDDELAASIRLMKNFGFKGVDEVVFLGINGKMPEICAAMGLANLQVIEALLATNRKHHDTYRRALAKFPGIRFLDFDDVERANFQYVVIEVDEERAGLSRDALMAHLHANGILARRYYYPGCHRIEPYRSLYREQMDRLPFTDGLCRRVLVLPTGSALEESDVGFVCENIAAALCKKSR